jgi:PAS domain S-box-containing protein
MGCQGSGHALGVVGAETVGEDERFLRAIAANVPAVLFAVDVDGAIVLSDDSRLLGFRLGTEFEVGRSVFDACADRGDILSPIARALAGRKSVGFLRVPGERVFNTHFQPVRVDEGPVIGALAIAEEMTDQIRSDEALEYSAMKFDTLVDTLAAMVFIAQGTRFVYVNPELVRVSGYTRSELTSMNFWEIVHPDYRDLVRERGAARQRDHPVPFRYELKIRTKGGQDIWADFAAAAMEHSGARAILGVAFDITARKTTEDTVTRQDAALLEASKRSVLCELAGGIVHEINGPLAVVAAAADEIAALVAEENYDREAITILAATATRTVDRLSRIVSSVRDLSCDTASEPLAEVSVCSIIEDAVTLCQHRFRLGSIPLSLPDLQENLTLECRPTQVLEVILNLLYNASDAVASLPEKWVRLDVTAENGTVALHVTDSGTGIAPEIAGRIFESFFSTKGANRGAGLGLGISKRIVERHGGLMMIDMACPNTRFVVRLPRQSPCRQSV